MCKKSLKILINFIKTIFPLNNEKMLMEIILRFQTAKIPKKYSVYCFKMTYLIFQNIEYYDLTLFYQFFPE